MASNTPDLASVLQTLAQLAPPTSNESIPNLTQSSPRNFPNYGVHQYSYDVPSSKNTWSHLTTEDPRLKSRSTTPNSSLQRKDVGVDPATITEWPAALKHVMKVMAQNEDVQNRVKKLVRTQHDHERQWWAGREAIMTQQKTMNATGKQEDQSGTVDVAMSRMKPDAELSRYDAKVYKAQVEMAKAMDGELRGLGIPFFAIKHQLVLTSPDQKDGSWLLERDELMKLQRRILELLEDLCKD